MTAKEMFEKEGYKLNDQNKHKYIEYVYKNKWNVEFYILFDLKNRNIEFGNSCPTTYVNDINMNVFKAINEQIEELGWEE